ncbi:MAG: hypothetical protein LBT14_03165 [Treponema sp.]|jgi:hypothetical protein|nr:hypothetical protein [Treponema sp.]
MKGLVFFVMICLTAFSVTAYSPVVEGYHYGGQILYRNASSHNLYMVLEFSDDPNSVVYDKNLCLEKNDKIVKKFQIHTDNEPAVMPGDPNDVCRKICFYDMDSGLLLKELTVEGNFIKTGGSLENLDVVFELVITDILFNGGI